MLFRAWGTKGFLAFNTKETWDNIQAYAKRHINPEYYRYNLGRKEKGRSIPFYTLIPMPIISEILQSGVKLPFTRSISLGEGRPRKGQKRITTEGHPFDMNTYYTSSRMMGTAFTTARRRAAIPPMIESPSKHDLRDAFRSRAAQVGCAVDAAEFAMGHRIDPLNYNKVTYSESWLWSELRKIYGPTAASTQQVTALQQALEQENKILKDAVVSALLPQRENLLKALDDLVAVQLRKYHLHAEGGLDDLPPKFVTAAMRELDRQLENINQQLEALGRLKRVEPVRTKR